MTQLTFRANGEANSYALIDDEGDWFMSLLVNGRQMEAKQINNMRRLAACWNACEGIDTEDLEAGKVSIIQKPHDAVAKISLERHDVLLRVAAWLTEEYEQGANIIPDGLYNAAIAAIAKAEGGAA